MARVSYLEPISRHDIVSELIAKPFHLRPACEQEILLHQKPRPRLKLRTAHRKFQQRWYAKKEWLCGSSKLQKMFCWPCLLLFPGMSVTWTRNGYSNVRSFLSDCKKHEVSQCHLEAIKTVKAFEVTGKFDVLSLPWRWEEAQRHSEQVGQSRGDAENNF